MFAKRFKELRLSKGLDQKAVAIDLGVLDVTISMWETGKRVPYYELLIKISKYFNVSIDFLLGNDDVSNNAENDIKEIEFLKNYLVKVGYIKDNENIDYKELNDILKIAKYAKGVLESKNE